MLGRLLSFRPTFRGFSVNGRVGAVSPEGVFGLDESADAWAGGDAVLYVSSSAHFSFAPAVRPFIAIHAKHTSLLSINV